MKGKSSNFIRKKEIAVGALLTEPTIQSAAKVAGIFEVTMWRWMQDEEFSKAYRELKREAVGQAIPKLQKISVMAVETLKKIMASEDAPPTGRVTAAKSILEMTIKGVELEDISRRVEVLEESLLKEAK